MLDLLWLIPALPFLGFVLLAIFGRDMTKPVIAAIGAGSVGLAALLTIILGIEFLGSPPAGNAFTQTLWTWMAVGPLKPEIAFRLDALSLVMIFVITFVGFLIHIYSTEYMEDDPDYRRFFAYMNLFVGNMLVLVLADNLLLLYLGWEGVGLCSYLLIGFWYKNSANVYAAMKAFIVTRVGDTAMAIGLFLLIRHFGTLHIQQLLELAPQRWVVGTGMATAVAALLLGGAVGKSAQLPLHTWLPDAMAGPTPTSALIHAATMVTAGVYLIARTHVLFELAPAIQLAVGIIGAATLLVAGFSALTQRDIKRVLAYSTVSQIGYMFLALGVGAYTAAMFHFMTHAFFKALLFLGAGAVINAMHHEQDMFKMGGLRKYLPLVFWTFMIGGASLAALPLVTAGFYSKDLILWESWSSPIGSGWFWAAGLVGAFITALYTFRMIVVTFYGEREHHIAKYPRLRISLPLGILAVLSVIGGFVETPSTLGHITLFSGLMRTVFPQAPLNEQAVVTEILFQIIPALVVLAGIFLAYRLYLQAPQSVARLTASPSIAGLKRFWAAGWMFDWLYDRLFVLPYLWFAAVNKNDVVDLIYRGIALASQMFNFVLVQTENGRVRTYAAGIAAGAVVIIFLVLYL